MMKGKEKSNPEILKDLVATSVESLAPAVKAWANGQNSPQQPPTPEEMARLQQVQQQTEQPAEQPQPVPEAMPNSPSRPIKPEEDEVVIDNMLSQQFGGDGTGGYKNVKKEV